MGESNTLRLDSDHWDGIDQRVETGEASNRSEAARQIMSAGLHSLGYQGGRQQSSLARTGHFVGWACGLFALAWLTVTLAYPVELRVPALAMMFASLGGFGVARVGDGLSLRRRLAAALDGEKA